MVHYHEEERTWPWGGPPVCNAEGGKRACACCHHAALCKASVLYRATPILADSFCVWLLKYRGPEHSALCMLRWRTKYFQSCSMHLLRSPHHGQQRGVYSIFLLSSFSMAARLFFPFLLWFSFFLLEKLSIPRSLVWYNLPLPALPR